MRNVGGQEDPGQVTEVGDDVLWRQDAILCQRPNIVIPKRIEAAHEEYNLRIHRSGFRTFIKSFL